MPKVTKWNIPGTNNWNRNITKGIKQTIEIIITVRGEVTRILGKLTMHPNWWQEIHREILLLLDEPYSSSISKSLLKCWAHLLINCLKFNKENINMKEQWVISPTWPDWSSICLLWRVASLSLLWCLHDGGSVLMHALLTIIFGPSSTVVGLTGLWVDTCREARE